MKVYVAVLWNLKGDVCLANLTSCMGEAFSTIKKAEQWVTEVWLSLNNDDRKNAYVWPESERIGIAAELFGKGKRAIPGFSLQNGMHCFAFSVSVE